MLDEEHNKRYLKPTALYESVFEDNKVQRDGGL